MDKPTLTFGSLFSGIGGLDLGLERSGMRCEWQVEIDDYATKVLAKHWPNVTRFRDVYACGKDNLVPVDLLCGGFPCQPHSFAGKRKAGSDERNLWPEFYRIIREIKPRWVMAENVLGLLSSDGGDFFGGILRDLAQAGYDAEWEVLRAADFDLPHIRERVFLLAYPTGRGWTRVLRDGPGVRTQATARQEATSLDSVWDRLSRFEQRTGESSVLRSNDGLPSWMDRLERLGNAVVPVVAEFVGRCIVAAEAESECVA